MRNCDTSKAIMLVVQRDACASDVLDVLAVARRTASSTGASLGRVSSRAARQAPLLCQHIHEKSKFKDEIGEGKGLLRSIMNTLAADIKAGGGGPAGLVRPSPNVKIPATGSGWNELETWDRDGARLLGFTEQTWPEWAGATMPLPCASIVFVTEIVPFAVDSQGTSGQLGRP